MKLSETVTLGSHFSFTFIHYAVTIFCPHLIVLLVSLPGTISCITYLPFPAFIIYFARVLPQKILSIGLWLINFLGLCIFKNKCILSLLFNNRLNLKWFSLRTLKILLHGLLVYILLVRILIPVWFCLDSSP